MEIIVFTNTGKTFIFKGVENFEHTTQGFKFEFKGVSTGVEREAYFNYTSVAGYSVN